MEIRLGVNIDHVATLRNARGTPYPSLTTAAQTCLQAGAHQITLHWREDERHIQFADVADVLEVCREFKRPLNLELSPQWEMFKRLTVAPDWLCIVPEKRLEQTTEGGLDLGAPEVYQNVYRLCHEVKAKYPKVRISLFVEAQKSIFDYLKKLPIDALEIHTGAFAQSYLKGTYLPETLEDFKLAHNRCQELNLGCHAGHGLNFESCHFLVQNTSFAEYNIGHFIIAESIFGGLEAVVKKFLKILKCETW